MHRSFRSILIFLIPVLGAGCVAPLRTADELDVAAAQATDATPLGDQGTQPIELPGKRKARQAAAEVTQPVVEREAELFHVELRADVSSAFWSVLYSREALKLADKVLQDNEDIEAIVDRRVEGGEASRIDQIKARVETLKARRKAQAQKRRLFADEAALAALCGGVLPEGFELAGDFSVEELALKMKASPADAQSHPLLRKLDVLIERQRAIIRREEKSWHPDLKPGVFAGREMDADKVGVTLGVQLPIFNRNQGDIAAAMAELNRLEAERARVALEVKRDAEKARQSYEGSREQLAAFDSGLREGAAEALQTETFLYEQGETGFLQVLDARRTTQETESEYLKAIYDAAIAGVELERAFGELN